VRRIVLAAAAALVIGLVVPGSPASAGAPVAAPVRTAAAVAPTFTVTPNTDLVDDQQVVARGSGFPQQPGVIVECVVGGSCEEARAFDLVDADGTFAYFVVMRVRTDLLGVPGGNCMTTACELRVSVGNPPVVAHAPLTFRAGQTLPPLLTVTPGTGLVHDQTVQVTGTAFRRGVQVALIECIDATFACSENLQGTGATVDGSGNFAASVKVTRQLEVGPADHPTIRDCATDPIPCTIRAVYVVNGGPVSIGSGPLHFDASTPPLGTPTLSFSPPRAFQAVETATFDLTHFTPGAPAQVRFCAQDDHHDICGAWESGVADATGAAHLPVGVQRLVVAPDGTDLDCNESASCRVEARGIFAYEHPSIFVGFDFASPIPGRPSVAVHDLTVTEGSDGGQTRAQMRITLSSPAPRPLIVGWATNIGVPSQVNPDHGLVKIPTGAVDAVIPMRVVADRTDEPDLTLDVGIGGVGFAVSRGTAHLRVVDDDLPSLDPPPNVYVALGGADEDSGVEARSEIFLSAPAQHTVIVHYHTVDVTAKAGSDYVAKRSSIVFHPGETRHVLRFQIVNDDVPEGYEHFRVVVSKVDGGILARGNGVVIYDND
jgi:Calx-beta domain/Neocarzinostatin family